MNFPYSHFKIAAVGFKSNSPTTTTQSKSLIRHVRKIPAHCWELNLKSVKLSEHDYRVCQAFIDALEGRLGTFTLIVPRHSQPLGLAAGSPVSSGLVLAGYKSVQVSGFIGAAVQVKAGDFFKFSNHTKVYRAVADLTSLVNGTGTLQFIPRLTRDIPTGTAIQFRDVPFLFRQKSDVNEYFSSAKDARKMMCELDLEEVL